MADIYKNNPTFSSPRPSAYSLTSGGAYENKGTKDSSGNPPVPNSTVITSSIDTIILDEQTVSNVVIDRTFGHPEDYIELFIYNTNGEIIAQDLDFQGYTFSTTETAAPGKDHPHVSEIEIDTDKILTDNGLISGKYLIKLNILKNKIFNTNKYPFRVKEKSSDNREIKASTSEATNDTLEKAVNEFISDIQSSPYFKEYALNFGGDLIVPAINVRLDKDTPKYEILFRTLMSNGVGGILPGDGFKVVEEIVNPIRINVDLGSPTIDVEGIPLREPNYQIDIRQNGSIPSNLKSYDDILSYNITSSFQQLLSKLNNDSIDLNIDYDYIRPIHSSSVEETFHFENFIHFGSAKTMLENFRYKLKLIESYDKDLTTLNAVPGSTNSSSVAINTKNKLYLKKDDIIKNFSEYEHYLYFTSGTYAWPKQNTTSPYILKSISSSEAKEWLGNDKSSYSNYGGQLLSASLFDRQNPHNLNKLIPNHITDNLSNKTYVKFIDMVGQHFDSVWAYIKSITSIYDSNNNKGITKDLAYYQLQSLGIETFDQFENSNLLEYILGGEGVSGSKNYTVDNYFNYSANHPSSSLGFGLAVSASETLITASNDVSLPKGDLAKEIWKRLYHNSAYLLKTKGTERGIRALMSCYGVPHTILNIKEYGGSTTAVGPLKDLKYADHYKTFTYQKSGLALKGTTNTSGYFIKTAFNNAKTKPISSSAKTVEFRIKPIRSTTYESYHLMTLSGSNAATDLSLILVPHQGNDIYSTGDADDFGKISLLRNGSILASTSNFPIHNGNFWNIFVGTDGTSGSSADVKFGAYQANFNKNVSSYTASISYTEAQRANSFGDPYFNNGQYGGGSNGLYFGGVPAPTHTSVSNLIYNGFLQGIKVYFHQSASYTMLTDSTLKKHALEPFMYGGNHLSSSFDELVIRLPLGSNDLENSSSFHPNIDIDYQNGIPISSSMVTRAFEEVIEDHHLPTPDTVGISATSENVRIDEGIIEDNILSPFEKKETSTLDRQPQDFEDLGIYFSPTNEINEDILYTLGSFRLDDFIGDPLPSAQSSSVYNDLKDIKKLYAKKLKNRYNYWAYIKQIQYIDHTLFKMIEQFVPFRANTKTGLLIEPNYLERPKLKRTHNPIRSDAQTMITGSHQTLHVNISSEYDENRIYQIQSSSTDDFGQSHGNPRGQFDPGSYVAYHSNPHKFLTSSKGTHHRKEQGTNAHLLIYDEYLDPTDTDPNRENQQASQAPIKPFTGTKPANYVAHESSVLLGNVIGGKISNRYYKYAAYNLKTGSLYT